MIFDDDPRRKNHLASERLEVLRMISDRQIEILQGFDRELARSMFFDHPLRDKIADVIEVTERMKFQSALMQNAKKAFLER